ncbi:MAG: S41 family peptidase [Bacteroidales bacterium]|jgi:carboxyl-terminal processing protease
MNKRLIIAIVLASFCNFLFSQSTVQQNDHFEISKNLEIFSSVYKTVYENYVDEPNTGELMRIGIDAMLKSLDPYTEYKSSSEIEDFRFMATGQYGGIGALIQQQGDFVVISEPYKGFPADKAGLKAGDKILKIEDKDVKGKTSSEVSELMKGEPNTKFKITVERYNNDKPLEFDLIREKVSIPSVTHYEVLEDNIGYIYLSGFTANASGEVLEAYNNMQKETKLEGLILDVRSNGGGLLQEAVNIINLFVPKDELIVSTKGRENRKNSIYKTTKNPVNTDIPLVVLINGASASASEILSGSIQDLDRGVIIGQRSFGKGLVQNILPTAYNSQVKVTISKYYIPSGRCIQAIDYSHKDKDGNWTKVPDSLMTSFSTRNGRTVYEGAGIDPDINIEIPDAGEISTNLFINHHFFNFATKFYYENIDLNPDPKTFEITDEIWNSFVDYLKDVDFEYTTSIEKQFERFQENLKKEKYYDSLEDAVKEFSKNLEKTKNLDLDTYRDRIEYLLGTEIITRYDYNYGRIIYALRHDEEVDTAIEVLKDKKRYNDILTNTNKKD